MKWMKCILPIVVVAAVVPLVLAQQGTRRPDFERPGQQRPLREVLEPGKAPKPSGAIVVPGHPPEANPRIRKHTVDDGFLSGLQEGQPAELKENGLLHVYQGVRGDNNHHLRIAELRPTFLVLRRERLEVRIRTDAITAIYLHTVPEQEP